MIQLGSHRCTAGLRQRMLFEPISEEEVLGQT
jgi:hypothetical protein